MTRPKSLRGLLCRLAISYPDHALIATVVGVCLFGVAAASRCSHVSQCRFEQPWFAGDVHFNERLDFREDATGTWIQGGFDRDAGRQHKDFRWTRTGSTLTVVYDSNRRNRVGYRLNQRRDTCYLTFETHPFLSDRSGFLHFSNRDGL